MKVVVDQLRCDTSGICVKERPDLFRFQEGSKKAAPCFDKIPPDLEDEYRRIAALCPTKAISLEE